MNILDENIPRQQRELLEGRRVSVKQIGVNCGKKGMLDDAIIPFLLRLRRPSFFTRDDDFYERKLCHPQYCLVFLDVDKAEIAWFILRFLRHPDFKTQASRMGKVLRVSHVGIAYWQLRQPREQNCKWPKTVR